MKKILLLSDTHGLIDDKIINYANSVDEIWHAGDIGDINVINNLQKYGLVRGVYGNIDNSLIKSLFSFKISKSKLPTVAASVDNILRGFQSLVNLLFLNKKSFKE